MNYKVPLDNTLDHPKKAQKEAQARIDEAVELTEQELGKLVSLSVPSSQTVTF